MDHMLELATALIRHVRDDKTKPHPGSTGTLAELRRQWRSAFKKTSDASDSPAMAKAAMDVLSPAEPATTIEPAPPDQDEELWLRAPDVFAVEVLADVLCQHPEWIPLALSDARLDVYPTFLEYLILTVGELATPPTRVPSWRWVFANEHVNLHEDRHEAVAKLLTSTDSWAAMSQPSDRDPAATPPKASGERGGVSASMFGAGEIQERARQFREQCGGTCSTRSVGGPTTGRSLGD